MSEPGREALREELAGEEARLLELDEKRNRVRRRISDLRANLLERTPDGSGKAIAASAPGQTAQAVTLDSTGKLALFRKLFRGRPDVFPRRWVNVRKKTNGYSPACANEWVRGVCEKPRVKCGDCPSQAFLPVSDRVLLDHLQGRHVVGVYPLLEDETCWFLAVDFDKGQWQEDVAAFVATCGKMDLPAAVERSRSGDGAHVWFFFQAPVAAGTARKMGCFLITETMARRHELPLTSYDRLFPNQDTLPRGGFGNLIALPFQDGPRRNGNSLFVDGDWRPFPDQWGFLSSVRCLAPGDVDALAREASESGQVIGARWLDCHEEDKDDRPWTRTPSRRGPGRVVTGPLPEVVNAVLGQQLFVDRRDLPSPLLNQIKRIATFQNPEFYKKQAMRLSTALTPRVIGCAEDLPQHVGLPRGCLDGLVELLAENGVELRLEDRRTEGSPLVVQFRGRLTEVQDDALQALLEHDIGVLVAPPGAGKTVVGASLVARRGRSTLVLVHRTQLLDQWIAQLCVFLDRKTSEVGRIGGGTRRPNGSLDVAMIQSLVRRGEVDDLVAQYGHVVVDECHHVPAVSFEQVMREVKARYVTGLTATPRRRDGHHPILHFHLGPSRFTMELARLVGERPFVHRLIVRDTGFRLEAGARELGIQEVYRRLTEDRKRNEFILDDVIAALEEGRSPILLTERRDHLDYFAEHLRGVARNLIVMRGGMRAGDRRETLERLSSIPDSEERMVLATGRFAGEGFDDARLDTLFLALPVSWKGTLVQYAGRLHRCHLGKTEVRVVDYVDRGVPMLARMFDRRLRGYRAMGYVRGEHAVPDAGPDLVVEYDHDPGM
jgi:superfamily II DNA or RNA helicase